VAWDSALTSDMIFTQPVLYEFPLLATQTLLIIGQRDRTAFGTTGAPDTVRTKLGNYPTLGKTAARAIKHSQLVEISRAGHLPQIEAFDLYIHALVQFLSPGVTQVR
jgi:pimeloyl-ACP methyl ester carboxylesterase